MRRECRHVYYSGRVQGVGFRFTAHSLARAFDVNGYVRNLPDGRVELLAEGDSSELDKFLAAIRAELAPYIHDIEIDSQPTCSEPLNAFTIRY